MNDLMQTISNVGFPIFACIMMFNQQKELNNAIMQLSITLSNIDKRIEMLEDERSRYIC